MHPLEFMALADQLDPSKYIVIGVHLGFSLSQLNNITQKHLNNIRNSLVEVFNKWDTKQVGTGTRQILAEKLRVIEMNDLAEELLNGLLVRQGKFLQYILNFSTNFEQFNLCVFVY